MGEAPGCFAPQRAACCSLHVLGQGIRTACQACLGGVGLVPRATAREFPKFCLPRRSQGGWERALHTRQPGEKAKENALTALGTTDMLRPIAPNVAVARAPDVARIRGHCSLSDRASSPEKTGAAGRSSIRSQVSGPKSRHQLGAPVPVAPIPAQPGRCRLQRRSRREEARRSC